MLPLKAGTFSARHPSGMLFNTATYFVFFAVTATVYWMLSHRRQNLLLLGASVVFYGWWDWRFLFLLLASALIDFAMALRIADAHDREEPRAAKRALVVSIVFNLGVLGFFKYFNFFVESAEAALRSVGYAGLALDVARHSSGGDFLLHLPVHVLHDRCLPATHAGDAPPAGLHRLRVLLSATHRWANRARDEVASTGRTAEEALSRRHRAGAAALRIRSLSKGCDRGHSRRDCRQVLR